MSNTELLAHALIVGAWLSACVEPSPAVPEVEPQAPHGVAWSSSFNAALGRAVAISPGQIIAGAPTHGGWEDTGVARTNVYRPPFFGDESEEQEMLLIYTEHTPAVDDPSRIGYGVLAPGDLDGDGVEDAVTFGVPGDVDLIGASGFLITGAVTASSIAVEDPASVWLGDALHGAPCGDVTGDEVNDLCLSSGIVHGPIEGEARLHSTWSSIDAGLAVQLVAADANADGKQELFLWDPGDAMLHHIDTFPQGDHDPEALAAASWVAPPGTHVSAMATGDLTGDGHPDVVVAWSDANQSQIAILTDAGGGDLTATEAAVYLPASSLGVGDLNGDGQADLVVGYAHRDASDEVRVFFGPLAAVTTATEADRWWRGAGLETPTTEDDDDDFGTAVAVGDADGDGQDDVVIGAPRDDNGSGWDLGGRVYFVPGPI